MTPEQINNLIEEIHNECKERGDWDGLPDIACDECNYKLGYYDGIPDCEYFYGDGHGHMCCKLYEKNRNAYLAAKLDLITEAIVDAMRARREGKTWDGVRVDSDSDYGLALAFGLGAGYEPNLAIAAIRTMDLMGFYGETLIEYTPMVMIHDNALDYMRSAASTSISIAEITAEDSGIRNGSLSGIINRILRVAELDEIDLPWHINARREYDRSRS